jgi:hypothetical protein
MARSVQQDAAAAIMIGHDMQNICKIVINRRLTPYAADAQDMPQTPLVRSGQAALSNPVNRVCGLTASTA